MGGANTNTPERYETARMMQRMEPLNLPELQKETYNPAPTEPLRNMVAVRRDQAIKDSLKNITEYTLPEKKKPAAKPIANEGPYMNSATADYPDVRGDSPNKFGRDSKKRTLESEDAINRGLE